MYDTVHTYTPPTAQVHGTAGVRHTGSESRTLAEPDSEVEQKRHSFSFLRRYISHSRDDLSDCPRALAAAPRNNNNRAPRFRPHWGPVHGTPRSLLPAVPHQHPHKRNPRVTLTHASQLAGTPRNNNNRAPRFRPHWGPLHGTPRSMLPHQHPHKRNLRVTLTTITNRPATGTQAPRTPRGDDRQQLQYVCVPSYMHT